MLKVLMVYEATSSSYGPFNWEWLNVVTTIKVMKYLVSVKSFILYFVLKVLEAVYEMVLPGNNISNSDLIEQVGQTR